MRLLSVPLWIAFSVMPALAAPSPLDEAWMRGMRPRSDAAEQLAARVRASAQRGAVALVEQAHARVQRRKLFAGLGAIALALVLILVVRAWLGGRQRREGTRLRSVLDSARRRDEDRR